VNYQKKIDAIFTNEEIGAENLTTLRRFDDDLSIERKSIFRRYMLLYVAQKLGVLIKKDFTDMDKNDLKKFVRSMSHFKDASLRLYIVNIRQFFKYLYDTDDFPEVVRWIKAPKQGKNHKLPTDLITLEEIKTMIDSCDHPRDQALIVTLYESGCRIGEIVGLDIKDVVFDKYGTVIMVDGKTGMRRVRLINSSPYLTVWLNSHPKNKRTAPLFVALGGGNVGGRLLSDSANSILKKIAKRAGIEKNIHAHLFRHSRLTELAKFMTENELRVFAGWTGGSSMSNVYVHLSGSDIDKKILENAGILEEDDQEPGDAILKPQICPRCHEKNPATAKFCHKCSSALTIETAMAEDAQKDADVEARVRKAMESIVTEETFGEFFRAVNV